MPLHWLQISPESPLARHTIGEARIRSVTGASIVAIQRDGEIIPNPNPDYRLHSGDFIALFAEPDELARVEQLMAAEESDRGEYEHEQQVRS